MGKKRKQDQWRDDSSSSDVKRRRSCHCQNGETSRTNNGMPWEEFPYIFRDAVIELKDVIQVKVSTDEKFKRKIEKLKEKRRKDKNKHEQDLRILKEDFKILKEDHEELKIKIQEMRKEGCAEVNHYNSSPSQRSQLNQSTRLRLVIESSVSKTIYKKEPVETEDGGGHIKVVMYDGGNPIASDHPLASVRVDLVLIEGWFNEPKRDSWSKEEFEESIIKPRKGITRLVKTGTFDLIDGSCDHVGAIIMDNSQQREVKLGVRISVHTEIRVLEGVSNPFKVQEGKTKKTATNKKDKKHSPPVPTRNLVHTTSTNGTQHDHGKHTEFPTADTPEDNRLSYTPATVSMMVEGNGQALNGKGQQSCQQIPTQISCLPTSTHSMQYGQDCSLPTTSIQNLSHAAGNYPVNHHLLASGQDQYNNFPNASSPLAFLNNNSLNNIPQWTYIPEGEISVEDVHHLNVQTQIQETCLDRSADCQFTDARSPASKNTNQNKVVPPSTTTAAGRPPNSEIVEHPPLRTLGSLAMRTSSTSNRRDDMPMVYSKDKGPDGKHINGFLYRDREDDECIWIVCFCHGNFLTPAEFVKHAGGADVSNPLSHIVINPSPSVFS